MTDELEQDRTLEAARRQLQLLTDAIAHDLRAPLRSIDGFAAHLADSAHERLQPREREQLERIRAAATRMGGLLDKLGDLSRATHVALQPARVDLSLLAEWVLADLQAAEPERQAQLHVQPGMSASGDERLLRQLLAELLHNAWKFSAGAPQTRIEVGGRQDGGRLVLTVRDAGVGFDPRYAGKLFEPLQRLHGAEQGAGHGLGLAIARRIAERHGGRITAISQPGDGASFTVDLPDAGGTPDGA
jgi:signal transduction histidine kinase